jgi:hypothetical protein
MLDDRQHQAGPAARSGGLQVVGAARLRALIVAVVAAYFS